MDINLKELFKSDKEALLELDKLKKEIKKYKKFENHLFDNENILYEFLEFYTNISKRLERLYLYANINADLDLTNNTYKSMIGSVHNLINDLSQISSYVTPEILFHKEKEFKALLKKNKKLKEYERNFKEIYRTGKLVKTKEEEKIISLLESNFDKFEDASELLINADIDYGFIKDENGKDVKLTNSNYSLFLESKKREVRKNAFASFYKEIKGHENVFSALMSSKFSNNNKIASLRGFNSARDLSLYYNNIDSKVYDNLIKGVRKNLDKFYPYYEEKKRQLKLDELHIYDTYASVSSFDEKIPFEEGKKLVLKALSSLGDDYVNDLTRAFDECWIDSKIRDKKRDGGYCTCAYLTHPYVVINYEEKLEDVSTLAHELGHAMHYLYAMQNNKYQDYNYSIFVAEVASQVNEILLSEYILENSSNNEEKRYILDKSLTRFKSSIIRQTMFADFENQCHIDEKKGIILTKDYLEKLYYDLNKLYFGPSVEVDDDIKYECFRIPHFYYNFYVYQYATGYAAALKIAEDIKCQKEGALKKYLEFLKIGAKMDPVSSLKLAGVDILDDKIYDEVFDDFNKKIKLLERK